jgi:uncharacterized protein (DUF1015 family)
MSDTVRHTDGGAQPLELAPFRALRFDPDSVADLAAVTCPPYDVISADGVETYEASDPHNVVRLILPRGVSDAVRYTRAAALLDQWISDGVLVRDESPALFVYELTTDGASTIGLVGAVAVGAAGGPVLPHEDVFPRPVADRAALMAATSAQLEPILLTYEGDGPASDVVDETLTEPAVLDVRTRDGARHRIWRLTEPETLAAVADDLAPRQALIADGHHRYAAYQRLQETQRHGLAMLVDAARHPLRLAAIHRSISELSWDDALAGARRGFGSVELAERTDPVSLVEASAAGAAGERPVLVISNGVDSAVLSDPDAAFVDDAMPVGHSVRWRGLAASLACEYLLPSLWRVSDADPRVRYHHDPADAVERAADGSAVALVLPPPRLADVTALAANGERMPRKSTSFGPKPRTGFLMRRFDPVA